MWKLGTNSNKGWSRCNRTFKKIFPLQNGLQHLTFHLHLFKVTPQTDLKTDMAWFELTPKVQDLIIASRSASNGTCEIRSGNVVFIFVKPTKAHNECFNGFLPVGEFGMTRTVTGRREWSTPFEVLLVENTSSSSGCTEGSALNQRLVARPESFNIFFQRLRRWAERSEAQVT